MYFDIRKINPYYIYMSVIILVIFLYKLHWSILYPKLSLATLFFLFLTAIMSLLLGKIYNDNIQNLKNIQTNNVYKFSVSNKLISYFVILGVILDGVYSKGFLLLGDIRYGEEYGVPVLHVVTTILGSYEILVDYMIFLKNRNDRRRAFTNIVVLLGMLLLNLSRSLIIITLMNCLWISIYSRGRKYGFKLKNIVKLVIIGIFGMYIFGIAGNYRSNVQLANNKNMFDSSVIYRIGQPSSEFIESRIPGPFFWDYIYMTSALGNFQKITDSNLVPKDSISEYVVTQFFPSLISQRIYPNHKSEINVVTSQYRVTSVLNVGTVYFESFYLMGWLGVILFDVFILLFPVVYMIIIFSINRKYALFGLAILNTMYLMMLFDNMFAFTLISLQLFLPIVFGIFDKYVKIRIKL